MMVTFCSGVFLLLETLRRGKDFSDAALLMHVPENEGSNLYLNVQALRQSGLIDAIAGRRTEEEPEYQGFVAASGFNYRDDLDTVIAHFGADFNLFIARGRFSWGQISRYLKSNEAKCSNGLCSIPVSRGRYLSAMPLAGNVVALGIGPNRTVVYSALVLREKRTSIPTEPLWLELSQEFLKSPEKLPEGTRSFLTAVEGARKVFLAVAPDGDQFQARLLASFDSPSLAASRRVKLEETTELLQKFFKRDGQQPRQAELGAVLMSGKFEQQQNEVHGRWPLPSTLLRSMIGN